MAKAKPDVGGNDNFGRQRILDFSPDEASIPAAQKVLKKGGFGTVQATADGKGWWVVCQGLTDIYQVSVRVDDGQFTCECTCPSPKYPCKHALALLLYLHDHPEERAEPETPKHAATDFEALVRAVFQTPDDDTPRLVFADYLEENGEADRAALIRLQCEHARTAAKSARGKELGKEVRQLSAKVRAAAVLPLPEGVQADFHRGFLQVRSYLGLLHEVGALPEKFVRLFRDGWVETFRGIGYLYDLVTEEHAALLGFVGELDLSHVPMTEDALVSLVTRVASMRETGRLCRVTVAKRDRKAFDQLTAAHAGGTVADSGPREDERFYEGLTPQTFDLLLRAGRFRGIRRLTIGGRLGDAETERLTAELEGMEELVLSDWAMSPAGMAAVAGAPWFGGLRAFGLAECRLEPAHVAALARGTAPAGLETLAVSDADLPDPALAELARATRFRNLRVLGLNGNRFTPAGVAGFLRLPTFPALTHLDLTANPILPADLLPLVLGAADRPELAIEVQHLVVRRWCGPEGVRLGIDVPTRLEDDLFAKLPGVAGARRVTGLRVTRADVTAAGLKALAKAISSATFKELELRDMALRNEGAVELVAAFNGFKLKTLRLPHCRVQASGTAALAGSPLLDSVRVLDLTGNTIGKAGAAALAKSTHLGNLERLELTDQRIGEERKALKAKFGKKLVL